MPSIDHLLHINASVDIVFDAIHTVHGIRNWWTTQTDGSGTVGNVLTFRFGERYYNEMKVIELVDNSLIRWECLVGDPQWIRTQFVFKLDQDEGKSRLRFSHSHWRDKGDFFAHCNFSWGRYLESLRNYCESGKGFPFLP